jgi:preprotein translocase subunit YajC
MNSIAFVLLQATDSNGGGMIQLLFFGGIILVFYFFMIRPQQKRAKEGKNFQKDIKKGDIVVTVGGVHGKVFEILDHEIILDVDRGTKLKVDKTALSLESTKRINQEDKK